MVDGQIYDELKGKVSGEGTEQIQQFLMPANMKHNYKPEPLHKVVSSNDKYAIVQKVKSLWSPEQNYLTGINDEGMYFIHQIPYYPNLNDIDNIVNDVNMTNLGFERIQGDLLVKTFDVDCIKIPRMNKNNMDLDHFYFSDQPAKDNWFEPLDKDKKGPYGSFEHKGTDTIFRNHKIVVLGGIAYHNSRSRIIIAMGDQVIIRHPEHKTTELKIPKNKVLMFMAQKSPNDLLSD